MNLATALFFSTTAAAFLLHCTHAGGGGGSLGVDVPSAGSDLDRTLEYGVDVVRFWECFVALNELLLKDITSS